MYQGLTEGWTLHRLNADSALAQRVFMWLRRFFCHSVFEKSVTMRFIAPFLLAALACLAASTCKNIHTSNMYLLCNGRAAGSLPCL